MRISDPKRFGTHLMLLRKNAGITLDDACARMEMDKRVYAAIEAGEFSKKTMDIDDDLIDEWMDWLPGFSPATSPGVHGPPIRKSDVDREADGKPPSDKDRMLRRGEAAPQQPRMQGHAQRQPYQGLSSAVDNLNKK
jgi:hypothetical protein